MMIIMMMMMMIMVVVVGEMLIATILDFCYLLMRLVATPAHTLTWPLSNSHGH